MSVSVPTACSSVQVAATVASGSILNQTTSIPSQAIFAAPASGGLFRISVYAYGHDGANINPSVEIDIDFNDNGGSTTQNGSEGLPYSGNIVAQVAPSSDIVIRTDILSGSPTYNIYYTVEQLQ